MHYILKMLIINIKDLLDKFLFIVLHLLPFIRSALFENVVLSCHEGLLLSTSTQLALVIDPY